MNFTVGKVTVDATMDGGHSPEYHAERFTARMIGISDTVPEPLKLQALAFRESIRKLALDVVKRAIMSDRTTIIAALQKEGMHEAAKLVTTIK